MNKTVPLIFNNKYYYYGTIVKLKTESQCSFGFNVTLRFIGYDEERKLYSFSTIQNGLKIYSLSYDEIMIHVSQIVNEVTSPINDKHIDPNYIEGMFSAWIWYILIMIFAFFFKGIEKVMITWLIATLIFFSWRQNKIKGG